MGKLSGVLQRHAFQVLLLFVALIAFIKPLLLTADNERPLRVVLELFVPWGLVVLVLFLIGHGRARAAGDAPPEAGAGKRD